MTAVAARLYAFALPLHTPLRTAHGLLGQREGFLVELIGADGHRGYGEAMPLPSFGGETHEKCEKALRSALAGGASVGAAPVAVAAIECAQLDLEFRARGVSLAEGIRKGPLAASLCVNALVSGDTPDAIWHDVERLRPSGFRTWKLKLGAETAKADVSRVRALRAAVGADARIRLDANGAWSPEEARASLAQLAEFEIEIVEQPLAPGDNAALSRLRRASPIRIAADESVVDRKALRALIELEAVDAVALKIPVLGGATRALGLGREARAAGMGVYFTSFLDSSLGIALALQVASAFGDGDIAHGLGTASLLARDLAPPAKIVEGAMPVPEGMGIGVVPDVTALKAIAEFSA